MRPETWRRLGPAELAPAEAVARPVGLLRAIAPAGPPVLSWSRTTTPALVLGRSGTAQRFDPDAARAEGVVVVRRSSGGGPVLWDRDLLSLDVVLPRGHRLAGTDVVLAYRWLGEAIASALRTCGVGDVEVVSVERARRTSGDSGPAADACFGGISPFEVLAGGRKLLGLSQARRAPGTLLQAGIPMRLDAERLARLLGRDAGFARGLAGCAAGLDEVAPGVSAEDLVRAVEAGIGRAHGVRLRDDAPSPEEARAIAAVPTEPVGASPAGA